MSDLEIPYFLAKPAGAPHPTEVIWHFPYLCRRYVQGKLPKTTTAEEIADAFCKEYVLAVVLNAEARFHRFLYEERGLDDCRRLDVRIHYARECFLDELWAAYTDGRVTPSTPFVFSL